MKTEPVPVALPLPGLVAAAGFAANSARAVQAAVTVTSAVVRSRWGTGVLLGVVAGPVGTHRWTLAGEMPQSRPADAGVSAPPTTPPSLEEGVLRGRERAGGDVRGIRGSCPAELAPEVGVLLDEPRRLATPQARHVLPD